MTFLEMKSEFKNLSIYLSSICLSINCISIYLPTYISIIYICWYIYHLSTFYYVYIYLPVSCVCINLPTYLSSLSVVLCISPLSIYIFIYLPVYHLYVSYGFYFSGELWLIKLYSFIHILLQIYVYILTLFFSNFHFFISALFWEIFLVLFPSFILKGNL